MTLNAITEVYKIKSGSKYGEDSERNYSLVSRDVYQPRVSSGIDGLVDPGPNVQSHSRCDLCSLD
jgi:hypothetical protein